RPEHRPDLDLTAVARPGIHMPQLHRPVKGSRLWARKDTRAWFGGLGHPPNLADLAPQVEHGHDLGSLRQRWGMGGGWLSGDPPAAAPPDAGTGSSPRRPPRAASRPPRTRARTTAPAPGSGPDAPAS